jgi:hypothetical protein
MILFYVIFYWIKTIVKIVKLLFKLFYMVMFLCIKGQFDKISCEMDQKIERKLDIKML